MDNNEDNTFRKFVALAYLDFPFVYFDSRSPFVFLTIRNARFLVNGFLLKTKFLSRDLKTRKWYY